MAAYDRQWRKTRLVILQRDHYRCQIRLAGCTGAATQVDHIEALMHGGARLDPSNLRAACTHCNASLGGHEGAMKREPRSRRWR